MDTSYKITGCSMCCVLLVGHATKVVTTHADIMPGACNLDVSLSCWQMLVRHFVAEERMSVFDVNMT